MRPAHPGRSIRSSAATAASVCSDFSATLSSSSGSVRRASACETRRAVGRMATDRAQRTRIFEQIDERMPDLGVAVLADDERPPRACDPAPAGRRPTSAAAAASRRLRADAGEVPDGFGAHVLVRIGARNVRQDGDVVQPRDGRAPDTRLGVLAGQRSAARRPRRGQVRRRPRREPQDLHASIGVADGFSRECPLRLIRSRCREPQPAGACDEGGWTRLFTLC